jgi:membrane protease YdiL (CAAX protease family)
VVQEMAAIVNKSMPLLVFASLTAGFTEELIFRAYLVPRLELLFKSKPAAVIISALLFSMAHYHYFSVGEMVFTFCLGVVFAIYYKWYRNIKVLIFTHAFIDFVSFLVFGYLQAHQLHK